MDFSATLRDDCGSPTRLYGSCRIVIKNSGVSSSSNVYLYLLDAME